MFTLAMLREGQEARVVTVIGGRGAIRNLMAIGIVPGKRVKVLGRRGGAMLVSVDGTKYVLGRGLAMRVVVDVKEKI
ncbi:ferrous iron transport protein A [Archaeoglobales archaeon]|nr:MAG: ferrous iron transport protein A [Archaeoglobales archaeon ex4484_92]RLI83435.1 MAG: ferrous iron transport protein A [Archaeoglobales archaeon]HDN74206.1 ferrous iron transport protein A [Archaeoglobus sp.]